MPPQIGIGRPARAPRMLKLVPLAPPVPGAARPGGQAGCEWTWRGAGGRRTHSLVSQPNFL